MRATVDRAGLDPHGRVPKVQVRRVRKGDLSKVRDVLEQTFGDFLERQLGSRPRQAFGGAQYVHHRWLMEPWGCFVAEEDGAKIVGAAIGVTWGSVGLVGPVAVLTHYHNQSIGQQLIRAVEEFFEENKTSLQGLVTYPASPKHLALYHKFGYRPKGLTAIMSRALGPRAAPRPARPPGLVTRRFSTLEETRKKTAIARFTSRRARAASMAGGVMQYIAGISRISSASRSRGSGRKVSPWLVVTRFATPTVRTSRRPPSARAVASVSSTAARPLSKT